MEWLIVLCVAPMPALFAAVAIVYSLLREWRKPTVGRRNNNLSETGESVGPLPDELWPLLHMPVRYLQQAAIADRERACWQASDYVGAAFEVESGVN